MQFHYLGGAGEKKNNKKQNTIVLNIRFKRINAVAYTMYNTNGPYIRINIIPGAYKLILLSVIIT